MTIRPQACRWFELITTREDFTAVLATLAHAGAVELQAHREPASAFVVQGVASALEHVQTLARRYAAYWPPVAVVGGRVSDPAASLEVATRHVDTWCVQADPLIEQAERLEAQARALADLARLLEIGGDRLPAAALLAGANRHQDLAMRCYALPAPLPAFSLPADALVQTLPAPPGELLLALGRPQAIAEVDARLAATRATRIDWPEDLVGEPRENLAEIGRRRAANARAQARIHADLAILAERHSLAGALATVATVNWLHEHGRRLASSERLVWITGWTIADNAASLCEPVNRAGLHCAVRFPAAPEGMEAPARLVNPRWARAFETFARLLGQPGPHEADPSMLVAFVAPVLFGFMFGDVGQGLVLCAAGWLLRRRFPVMQMLVPGGAMAAFFGLAFGSLFAREDLVPALWIHPLSHPVTLLAAAVGVGALILACGLALAALQAHWRGEHRRWWSRDAGLVCVYLSLLGAIAWRPLIWGALAGAIWYVLGAARQARARRMLAALGGAGELLEKGLQLAVNTVSFARVGAFALAHAGLSSAVVGLAEAAGSFGYWIVLALGNLLILGLEGLVVGIQTTRLLMFEFFVRFLQASGRPFRPLAPPVAVHENPSRRPA
ncbi:MAG: hypothetical protein R3E48_15765 [Burkholderiaceae bacterium]